MMTASELIVFYLTRAFALRLTHRALRSLRRLLLALRLHLRLFGLPLEARRTREMHLLPGFTLVSLRRMRISHTDVAVDRLKNHSEMTATSRTPGPSNSRRTTRWNLPRLSFPRFTGTASEAPICAAMTAAGRCIM